MKTAEGYDNTAGRTTYATVAQAWALVMAVEAYCAEQFNLLQVCEQLDICPEGLLDADDTDDVLELEQLSETYHIPPTQGSLEDMPARLYDAFGVIRRTHVRCQNEAIAAIKARQGRK